MRLCSLISIVCLVGLLTVWGVAVAQELDANWVVGKWQGLAEFVSGKAQLEITVKSDGTFEGDARAQGLGLVYYREGKWGIAGDTITFTYLSDAGARGTSKGRWTLKRNEADLEGNGTAMLAPFSFL